MGAESALVHIEGRKLNAWKVEKLCQAHRLLYHLTLGLRVIKKKEKRSDSEPDLHVKTNHPFCAIVRVGFAGGGLAELCSGAHPTRRLQL